MSAVRPVTDVRATLGEGPVWSPAESALYWIDIVGQAVYRLDGDGAAPRRWELPAKPGCVAPRESGGLVVALPGGVHALDLGTGAVTPLAALAQEPAGNRLNDGAADHAGRFWVGSMDDAEKASTGALYRIEPDGTATAVLHGLGVANGIGWSPDGGTLYHTDSTARTITAYDFDVDNGELHRPRPFASDDDCYPDGLTVDAEGYVWSAKWDGWRVVRYAPDGTVDRVLPMPVQRPSCVAFGGPDLDRLYITSARVHLTAAALGAQPLAGALLVLDEPGVTGQPEPLCRL
jgi:sugar lactone lactonase YvrE